MWITSNLVSARMHGIDVNVTPKSGQSKSAELSLMDRCVNTVSGTYNLDVMSQS